jgi:hypothetical protein
MTTPVDSLLQSFDARTISAIARELGVSPREAGASISEALPLLLGQMASNAEQPEGASALLGAVQRDHTGVDLGGLLGGLFGGRSAPSQNAPSSQPATSDNVLSQGMAILGHVFGGGAARTQPQTPQVGGLGSAGSAKLLALLAPMVMAWLGKANQGGGLDLGSLGQILGGASRSLGGGQQASPAGGLFGAILDKDGDGNIGLDEMLGAAQSLGLFGGKSR